MGKLYKQFVGLVTRWIVSNRKDEFLIARLKLTFYYSITALVILVISSIVLYNTILSNFAQSIRDDTFLSTEIAQTIVGRAQDILLNRFVTIDSIILFFIIILGFLLTERTLQPIKENMEKQKRFIADASHELRTPIAVVISGLEVNLKNKKLDIVGAKGTLEKTLNEMREFSKLSNSLLDISKYDAPTKTKFELIAISDLVKSIVEKNRNLATIKNIEIEERLESNVFILGNKIELSRVFFNILDNAIKYTPMSGTITVSDKIISNKYILAIRDNGVGIKSDILDKIFDPFFRGDESRNTEGAGLGLTLSKKIIEDHRGTISIKSEVNKGTNVTISLPIASQ